VRHRALQRCGTLEEVVVVVVEVVVVVVVLALVLGSLRWGCFAWMGMGRWGRWGRSAGFEATVGEAAMQAGE
jgi:hypothetical protein